MQTNIHKYVNELARDTLTSFSKKLNKLLEAADSQIKMETVTPKEVPYPSWPWPTSMEEQVTTAFTAKAVDMGVKFIHFKPTDYAKHPCTIAYRPIINCKRGNGKMVEVAVTYLHPGEQYNKKRGAEIASERFLNGMTVTLPFYDSKDKWRFIHRMSTAFANNS